MTRAARERALSLGSALRDGMGDVQEEKLLVKCKSTIIFMYLNVLLRLSFFFFTAIVVFYWFIILYEIGLKASTGK